MTRGGASKNASMINATTVRLSLGGGISQERAFSATDSVRKKPWRLKDFSASDFYPLTHHQIRLLTL